MVLHHKTCISDCCDTIYINKSLKLGQENQYFPLKGHPVQEVLKKSRPRNDDF
jgi:hypothetical protein